MTDYGVQASVFREDIYIGRLNKAGDAFADKVEATDMTLFAVAQYVEMHFGGGFEVTFPKTGLRMRVAVTPIEQDDDEIERLCKVMHDAYEAAAVKAGWETQARSRMPWGDVPEANKATMRAAVSALLAALPTPRLAEIDNANDGWPAEPGPSRCHHVSGGSGVDRGRCHRCYVEARVPAGEHHPLAAECRKADCDQMHYVRNLPSLDDVMSAERAADLSAIIRDYLTNETDATHPSLHATALTRRIRDAVKNEEASDD